MPPTTEQFLKDLERSNLLQTGLVGRIRSRIAESKSPVDAFRAAKGLVDKGLISTWQARQLLAGRHAFYLGRYRLMDRVGKGGMGVVFKAQHAMMDRTVALKVMSHALLKNPRAVARFNREVKTAAALNHANIIAAYDADAVGNTHFLVMEYADGQDLNQWLRARGPMSAPVACECALQAAEGLGHAYRQGMVHRDIKPVNLIVTWNKETDRPLIKILDMGLARFVSEAREEGGVTKLGQTIGTPDYIAPEAASNFKKADIRADIYSLGCALFKLLTGRLPFAGDNTMEKLLARSTRDAPPIRTYRAELPAELEAVVAKMLARNPDDRYQTPAELADDLRKFAASSTGNLEALNVFRDIHAAPDTTRAKIEPDADSSLDEFIGDFSSAPLREDAPRAAAAAEAASDTLGLAPDDESSASVEVPKQDVKSVKQAVRELAGAAAGTAAKTDAKTAAKKPGAAEPTDGKPAAKSAAKPAAEKLAETAEKISAADLAAVEVMPSVMPERPRRVSGKVKAGGWDSPLMIWGSAALVLMLFVGGLLFFYLNKQSGDQIFSEAENDYNNGSYGQAIHKYEQLLKAFPNHDHASTARVHQGMAGMRQAIDAGGDFSAHLKLSKDVLERIDREKDFSLAQNELIVLLPRLAEGLSKKAAAGSSSALVDETRQALALVEKYVAKNDRPAQALQAIADSLQITEHRLAQESALAKAVTDIREAVAAGKGDQAYEVRRQLLKEYPKLISDEQLAKATLEVTAAQRAAVKVSAETRAAETTEAASPLLASQAIYTRTEGKANGADGEVVMALAGGAAFGLDAADGRVLWHRHVGFDTNFVPQPVTKERGGDRLVVDSARGEILRIAAVDGALRWRQSCGGPIDSEPVVFENQILVTTAAGTLTRLDAANGQALGQVTIPQPLPVGPGVNARKNLLYQIADHSNLYVLSATDGQCQEAFYVGHTADTVRTPPIVLAGQQGFAYVVIAENRGAQDAVLRVLQTDENGLNLRQVDETPVEGHIHAPPLLEGRMLHVASDRGALFSYEVGTPDQPKPLNNVVARPATSPEHVMRFALLRQGQLFIADQQLTRYDFQPARGRLDAKYRYDQGDTFTQPLVQTGDYVFTARRRAGLPGVAVAAVRADDGVKAWETHVGAPVVGVAAAGDKGVVAVTAVGGALLIDNQKSPAGPMSAVGAPARSDLPQALDANAALAPLGTDAWAVTGGAGWDRALVIQPQAKSPTRWLTLPAGAALAAAPTAFRGGLLAPLDNGQVVLLDAKSGQPALDPFQPALQAGARPAWRTPGAAGDNEFVITDGRTTVYRVGVEQQPQPHLSALAQVEISTPLAGGFAVTGNTAYAADSGGVLMAFALPDLTPSPNAHPGGQVTWGPLAAVDTVLVGDSNHQLTCLDGAQQRKWQVPLPHGRPVGAPLLHQGSLVLASSRGVVWKLDAATGQEQAHVETGRPLSSSPLAVGDQLLLPGADGALHRIAVP